MENLENLESRRRNGVINLKVNSVGVKKSTKRIRKIPNLKNKQYESPVSKSIKPNCSTVNNCLTKDVVCDEESPRKKERWKLNKNNVLNTIDCVNNEDKLKNKSIVMRTMKSPTVQKEEVKKKKRDKYNIKKTETISIKQKLESCNNNNNNKTNSVETGKNKNVSASQKTQEEKHTARKKIKRIITSPLKHKTSTKRKSANCSTVNNCLTKEVVCDEESPRKKDRRKLNKNNVLNIKIDRETSTIDYINNEDKIKNKSIVVRTTNNPTVQKEEVKKKKQDKYNIKKTETISIKQKLESGNNNNNKTKLVETGKNKNVSASQKTQEEEHTARKKIKRIITSPLKHKTSTKRKSASPQSNKITKWLGKHVNDSHSYSLTSYSKKKLLDKKMEKYKFPANENSANASHRKETGCNKSNLEPKKIIKSPKSSKYKNSGRVIQDKTEQRDSTKCEKLDIKINNNAAKEKKHRSKNKVPAPTLDKYLNKTSDRSVKRKYPKSDVTVGCEFSSSVHNKKKLKSSRSSDSFKKYGVTVPSIEEILKDQQELAQYKNQIESFQDIDDQIFELPFSVKSLNAGQVVQMNVLGCKHLSVHDIEKAFYNNFDYISAIFNGTKYSERHERFFNKDKSYTFTVKDLCYNTSTIVFSFEQQEYLISLLKKEFDSDDKWTLYFFQVLLPELCLKIFMDTHSMEYQEAVEYLDNRPISDD